LRPGRADMEFLAVVGGVGRGIEGPYREIDRDGIRVGLGPERNPRGTGQINGIVGSGFIGEIHAPADIGIVAAVRSATQLAVTQSESHVVRMEGRISRPADGKATQIDGARSI